MGISTATLEAIAVDVFVDEDMLRIVLGDGREVAAPLDWFPRLRDAAPAQRARWRLIGAGRGIHWPDLDEDVSVRRLLGGPS